MKKTGMKSIGIDEDTFNIINDLSKFYKIKKYLLIRRCIYFFNENKNLFNEDYFMELNKEKKWIIEDKIAKMISSIMKKETNRVIGFIKMQDKFIQDFKKDILYEIGEEKHYDPLFDYYENIIIGVEKFLGKEKKDFNDIYKFLKDEGEHDFAILFERSWKNIQSKSLVY